MTAAALLTMGTGRWLTPKYIVDPCIEVLGPVDIDPSSEPTANERVGAAVYYNEEQDGLSMQWSGTIFCNPPGGKRDGKSLPLLLLETKASGRLSHAIFIAYSLEQFQTFQAKQIQTFCRYPVCIPRKRVRYDRPDGTPGGSPTHSSAIVYVPGRRNMSGVFTKVMSKLGDVWNS